MKKILLGVFLNFILFGFAQTLNVKLPEQLKENDLCIVYGINTGWSNLNYRYYYFLTNDRSLNAYKEEVPKDGSKNILTKISVTDGLKEKIIGISNSEELKELLKYKQEDFKVRVVQDQNKIQPPPSCRIFDSNGFVLKFIQNDKEYSYNYYAPKYFYEECTDKRINKVVLKKFIDVLKLF